MKKTNFLIMTVLMALVAGFFQPLSAKTILTTFATFDLMQKEGSDSDYLAGERDFCITDGHTVIGFGLGIKSQKPVYIGFELQYSLKALAIQTDPSDGDTVTIDTYPRALGSLLLGVRVLNTPSITLALEAGGGGLYLLSAEDRTYTSTAGYETIISAPKSAFAAHAFGGIAFTAFFSKSIGLNVGARYQYFFLSPKQTAFSLQAGLAFTI